MLRHISKGLGLENDLLVTSIQGFGRRRPEGKRPLRRTTYRWEGNIKMGLHEVRLGGMDWTDMAQDRDRWRALVNAVMNLRVP